MKKIINEAFEVAKGETKTGKPIAYLDPNNPKNKDSFAHKDIISKGGAIWSKSRRAVNLFAPHGTGFWFWYIGDTEDKWRNVYDKIIKPTLAKAHAAQGATTEESEGSLLGSINALIAKVESNMPATTGIDGAEVTVEAITDIKGKLLEFKERLVNLDSDEEYKETMRVIMAFKNAQGHQYSMNNTFLIWIQNRGAKFVMSPTRWAGYNRTVNENARPIIISAPSSAGMAKYSKNDKDKITQSFVNSVGKKDYNELSVGEKDKLGVKLRGQFQGKGFTWSNVYDVSDTTQIEGKEDFIKDLEGKSGVKWYEENMIDPKVTPIYNALLDYAKSLGVTVTFKALADMGGSRGSSSDSGVITLPVNNGDDVGLTKTMSHELSHTLLHQRYASDKNPELKQYFIGTDEGRGVVEQQAELAAWTVLGLYGFDLQTTSINYAALWGADKDKMIAVYDKISIVVNLQINEINKRLTMTEGEGGLTPARQITPMDIAREVGNEREYMDLMKKHQMLERFNFLTKKIM